MLAGLIAGVSLLFRETNPLLFLPLFVGAMLRRERHWMVIVLGGVLGGLLRPLVAFAITGDPLFVRPVHAEFFDWTDAARNAVLYLIALTIMIPGGIAAVLAYRGPRRVEIVTAVLVYTAFFVTYGYAGWESGWQKQLVLGPRFLLPMMPLLVLAMAEVFPSALAHLSSRLPGGVAKTAIAVWVVGVLISIVLAHWMVDRWGRAQQQIVGALYENTPAGAAVIIDPMALSKFANEVYGDRAILSWDDVPPELVARVLHVYGSVQVALLYRSDADYWLQRNQQGDRYIQRLESRCRLQMVHDSSHTATDRLRVWNVVSCQANGDS